MNLIHHHSASSIATYMDCPSKWAYTYLDGIRGVAVLSARYGTFLHGVMEAKRKTGHWPLFAEFEQEDGTKVAREVTEQDLAILREAEAKWGPYHAAGHLAEGKFEFTGRHRWVGVRDLRGPASVEDYKTTSDLKWAMREPPAEGQPRLEGVRYIDHDPQALLYAHTVAVEDKATEVALDWIYMKTRLPGGSKSVKLRISAEQAARGFSALEHIADLCEDTAAGRLPRLRNESACDKYGGCAFRGPSHCNISPFRQRSADMSNPAALLDRLLLGRKAEGLPTGPTPVAAPPPAAPVVPDLPVPAAPPVAAAQNITTTFSPPFVGEAPLAWAQRVGLTGVVDDSAAISAARMFGVSFLAPAALVQAINPPPTAPLAPPPSAPVAPVTTLLGQIAAPVVTAVGTPPAALASPVQPQPPAEAPKVRRGRPPGSRNVPKAEPSPGFRPEGPPPNDGPGFRPEEPSPGFRPSLGVLYIGCRPLRPTADVIEFDAAVAHARKEIAKQGCADWRLVEFGKGKAHLLEHVVAYLAGLGVSDLVVDGRSDEAQVCLPHLRAAAEQVVQAVAA